MSVAVRAEKDALPLTEKTAISFASENEGVMHECGHDAHVAEALGLALLCAVLNRQMPVEELDQRLGKILAKVPDQVPDPEQLPNPLPDQIDHIDQKELAKTELQEKLKQLIDEVYSEGIDYFRGKLTFLYQGAEENGTGATEMINAKALNGVDRAYAIHFHPLLECDSIFVRDGAFMASAPALDVSWSCPY
jgi:metal-dependent amidase/aminoacylase/carboxypeptidase family protein